MLTKDLDNLHNILDSIDKIEEYSRSILDAEDLVNDFKTFDAILMNFIVIGEMTAKCSDEFKNKYTEIEWWRIKGFRNIVAHNYFGIDAEEVWQLIKNKLPELKYFIQRIIKNN